MKKYFPLLALLLFSNANIASADVMNPDFLTKTCKPGETEVKCSYKSKDPFGSRTSDGCKKYASNSSYYYLVGHGSSFGGEEKYCLGAGAPGNASSSPESIASISKNKFVIVGGAVAVLAVISLLILFQVRRKSVHQ